MYAALFKFHGYDNVSFIAGMTDKVSDQFKDIFTKRRKTSFIEGILVTNNLRLKRFDDSDKQCGDLNILKLIFVFILILRLIFAELCCLPCSLQYQNHNQSCCGLQKRHLTLWVTFFSKRLIGRNTSPM